MGTNAHLLAIGPYKPEIAKYLAYPEEYYRNVREGVTVVAHVLWCVTTSQSHALANALGVRFLDFNTHDMGNGRLSQSMTLYSEFADLGFELEDVTAFEALRNAGFRFIFCPGC